MNPIPIRLIIYAVILLVGVPIMLLLNDAGKDEAQTQKCPKCKKRTLHRLKKTKDDQFSRGSNWKCANCGNDEDEFGNKL